MLEVTQIHNEQTIWDSTRVLLLHLYGMNPYIKKKPRTVTEVFKLPWDKKARDSKQTVEEQLLILKGIHAKHSRKKDKGRK